MKLVETDIPHGDEEVPEIPRPPRPEHRRVYVSLFVTLTVLVTTVVAVYVAFPRRDNALFTTAFEAHAGGGPFQLTAPSAEELAAWTVGVVGDGVPWPAAGEGRQVLGSWQISVLRQPAALVRYQVGDQQVTLGALRARDAPPRRHRRENDGLLGLSWRNGPWTLFAVGPAAGADGWRRELGIP